MRPVACRYAILQFAPYSETDEFANVGIVLLCPTTGYFGYQLQTEHTRRITHFFHALPRAVYLRAVHAMEQELQRIAQLVAQTPAGPGRAEALRHIFDSLTHPREAMLRFGRVRAVMAANPTCEIERLFAHYVAHSFATPEYIERTMEQRIKQLLNTLDLSTPFEPKRIGDAGFHAHFGLVQERDEQALKIIKPLRLNHEAPMQIYEHGDVWLQKIRRLRNRNLLPPAVLFAIRPPAAQAPLHFNAYQEICRELHSLHVQTVPEDAQQQIAEFAMAG